MSMRASNFIPTGKPIPAKLQQKMTRFETGRGAQFLKELLEAGVIKEKPNMREASSPLPSRRKAARPAQHSERPGALGPQRGGPASASGTRSGQVRGKARRQPAAQATTQDLTPRQQQIADTLKEAKTLFKKLKAGGRESASETDMEQMKFLLDKLKTLVRQEKYEEGLHPLDQLLLQMGKAFGELEQDIRLSLSTSTPAELGTDAVQTFAQGAQKAAEKSHALHYDMTQFGRDATDISARHNDVTGA